MVSEPGHPVAAWPPSQHGSPPAVSVPSSARWELQAEPTGTTVYHQGLRSVSGKAQK